MNPRCSHCHTPLEHQFVDLGVSPLANRFLTPDQLQDDEPRFPLVAFVCARCFLVQVPSAVAPGALFADYPYLSSCSDSWLAHARHYAETMIERAGLDRTTRVIEIGSNDGYLLQFFQAAGVPVLGIEPADNVAAIARGRGIETMAGFFGAAAARDLAGRGCRARLLVANNVFAHVPDPGDFAEGLRTLLDPGGLLTIEFPHLLRLMAGGQFDTIYHEHFSYFSLLAARRVLAAHDLTVVDVEELPTHGGSLRLHVRHAADATPPSGAMSRVDADEQAFGLDRLETYGRFAAGVDATRTAFRDLLVAAKADGLSVAAYGAPAKGNTLLNYCDIGPDLIEYTVDRNAGKQGRFLPGSHLPVYAPDHLRRTRPDLIVILPWNLKDEIMNQLADVRAWGGRFVIPIPRVEVVP